LHPATFSKRPTLATNYAARLLARFPGARRQPPAPDLERGKVPKDVYIRLLGLLDLIRKISHTSGLEMLELTVPENEVYIATPSDVYDIAFCWFLSSPLSIRSYPPGNPLLTCIIRAENFLLMSTRERGSSKCSSMIY
jgi:hypothetical protein